MNKEKTTHFGYQEIPVEEKTEKVAGVFTSVASKYDIMNDFMSLGIHRLWKRLTIASANVKPTANILDLAGGTGDLTKLFYPKVKEKGHIVLADINYAMLSTGRDRLTNLGLVKNLSYADVNAECLPFTDNHFDLITIAFGLRNVTDKETALRSMYRVLKPGGKLMILEFSKPTNKLVKPLYDTYSFNILPMLGKFVANDAESYQYLAESIRMHPDQETLKKMVIEAGFDDCRYSNYTFGIVALHTCYKY